MANLDVQLLCSRCEDDLSMVTTSSYNKVLPCDCVVDEIDTLENKIKELEAKIEKLEENL